MNDEDLSEELGVGLVVRDESESQKQVRAALFWTGIVVALIAFYVFGFPIAIFIAANQGWISSPVEDVVEFLLIPLKLLYEVSSSYESYIDWLQDVVP